MAEAKSSETPTITGAGKPVVTEKSLVGLDGWLGFGVVAFGANAVGYVWTFFLAIVSMVGGVEGAGLGVAIETLIFSLGLVFLCGFTLFLLVNRRKLATLWAYITLAASALFVTILSITTMFTSTRSCSYSDYYLYNTASRTCDNVGLPASMIVALIGLIFATWAGTLLVAYYFKKSQRVKLTLTK
jgi:hypothetical protein